MIRFAATLLVATGLLVLLLHAQLVAGDATQAMELLERGRTLLSADLLLQAKASFAACLRDRPEDAPCGYRFARASVMEREL